MQSFCIKFSINSMRMKKFKEMNQQTHRII